MASWPRFSESLKFAYEDGSDCKSRVIVMGLAIDTANSIFVGNNYAIERKLPALREGCHINGGSGNLLSHVKRCRLRKFSVVSKSQVSTATQSVVLLQPSILKLQDTIVIS